MLGLVATTTFVMANTGSAMYTVDGTVKGSGDQIRAMIHSGNAMSGMMSRQTRSTQLREKIGARGDAVDAIMNQWKGENVMKTKEERLAKFTEMHDRVQRIRAYVENMNTTEANKELYRNTFEYLSLQLEASIEDVNAEMTE